MITVRGIGLDPLTIDWADFGPPSGVLDGHQLRLRHRNEHADRRPCRAALRGSSGVPLSVRTVAGQSSPIPLTYAGVPNVTAVVNRVNKTALNHVYGAPDTGGTPIEVSGKGFQRQLIAPIEFSDSKSRFSFGTQYNFSVSTTTSDDRDRCAEPSPRRRPALHGYRLQPRPPADLLYLYPPGEPDVTSVTPASGPAAGGTKVQVRGVDLGCAIDVYFGNVKASSVSNVHSFLDCGATTVVDAKSPAGTAGSVVTLSVTTVESYFTRTGRGKSTAKFTYKKG